MAKQPKPKHKRKKRLFLSFLVAVPLMLVLVAEWMGLRYNATPSLPIGFYRLIAGGNIGRGTLVLACPENSSVHRTAGERGYLRYGLGCPSRYTPFLKRLMAVPGDKVEINREGIVINGIPIKNTRRLDEDSVGRPMPMPPRSGTVEDGRLWLLSSNPGSYDSRYFGSVPVGTVQGQVIPIWTFPDQIDYQSKDFNYE